ncbi:hypothetical protein HOLleu_36434 [Holothuria leucospilota]|uniref:Uncharacterized protein n=1 Tax=Holothuria leucospilota TaxID=206669 RepID=A0A9Q1BGL5_HOLLE|nr:hypothetical protein HOLleu_36434 [Holothuria leucospilota]
MAENRYRGRKRLTDFEEKSLKHMGDLLRSVRKKNAVFHRDYYEMNAKNRCYTEIVNSELRLVVIDLYSILDYLCQFLYSHFRNDGKRSSPNKLKKTRFPYFAANHGSHRSDAFSRFKRKARVSVFGKDGDQLSTKEIRLLKVLFNVQPGVNGGSSTVQNQCSDGPSDAHCFKMLHYLRNRVVHQRFEEVKEETVYWDNLRERSYTVQDDRRSLIPVAKSLSLQVPDLTDGNLRPIQILTVVPAMIRSVTNIVTECLEISECSLDCEGYPLLSRRIVSWNDDYIAVDRQWHFWEDYYRARLLINGFSH